MPRCPRCGSWEVGRLRRRRGILARLAALLLFYPYHCRKCERRFLVEGRRVHRSLRIDSVNQIFESPRGFRSALRRK